MISGRRFASAKAFRVFVAMAIFAMAFVVTEFFSLIGSGPWGSVAHLTALIAIAGVVYGTVVALDGRSGNAVSNHSTARMGLCAAFGAAAAYICGRGIRRVSLFGGSLRERLQAQCSAGTDGAGRSTSNFRIAVFKSVPAAGGPKAVLRRCQLLGSRRAVPS
jgi:hypothetical protein